MTWRVVLAVAVAFLCASPLALGAARAVGISDAHAQMVLTTNPEILLLNASMTVDVFTFYDGVPTDVDGNITGYLDVGLTPPLVGPFEHVDMGHYRTTVEVPADPMAVPGVPESAPLSLHAQISGRSAIATEFLTFQNSGPHLRVSVNNTLPWPGQVVQVQVESTNSGQRVDASAVTVTVDNLSNRTWHATPATREALGLYEATVTIPAYAPAHGDRIGIMANATFGGLPLASAVLLDGPQYQVWFHESNGSGMTTSADLWVADWDGRAAAHVAVNLWQSGIASTVQTDGAGRIPLTLDFSGSDGIPLSGDVAPSTFLETHFYGTAFAAGASPQLGVGPAEPALLPDSTPRDYLTPGASVTRRFQLAFFNASAQWQVCSQTDVSYYLQTNQAFVGAGVARTDANGILSVSFVVPRDHVSAAFVSPTCWGFYSWSVPSSLLGLEVSSLRLGEATHLAMSVDASIREAVDESGYGSSWGSPPAGGIDVLGLPSGEAWSLWTFPFVALFRDGDAYARDVYLPPFLPQNTTFATWVGGFVGSNPIAQLAVLQVGESATIPAPVPAGFWDAYGVLLLVTLPVVAFAAFLAWLHRRAVRRRPPAPPPGAT